MPQPHLVPPARLILRPVGSPLPLGLSGLTVASLLVSGLDLGWVATAESHQVGMLLLVVPVPLQAVACLIAFAARDGAAGTSMGLLAVSWAATGLIRLTSAPGDSSHALALQLFAAAGLLLGAAVGQAGGKPLLGVVVGLAALRFAFNGLYEMTGSASWQTVSGWVGIAVMAGASYLVWALAFEDAQDHTVLPVGRRGRGRLPAAGAHDGAADEPGVRPQL
jgi:succinate-acetate transporter protein